MNKYEKFFNEILNETRDGILKWRQLNKRENSEVIFNAHLVFRQFSTQLVRGDSEYTVLLVEKKYLDPDDDFFLDKYTLELLVLEQGELITCITESVIEKKDMIKLVDFVKTKSDKANKLFSQPRASELLEKLHR
jgi:hypothetical protein